MPAPNDPAVAAAAALLRQTGEAHHHAFAATNGEDPDWASWYAEYLASRLGGLLRTTPEPSVLASQLTQIEEQRKNVAPGAHWPAYYAERLMAWYGHP